MGVGGQRQAPAALAPVKTRYPLHRRLGRTQGRSGQVRKISPPSGFDPRTAQPLASRYTDWAIPAHGISPDTKCIRRRVDARDRVDAVVNSGMSLPETEPYDSVCSQSLYWQICTPCILENWQQLLLPGFVNVQTPENNFLATKSVPSVISK